MGGCATLSSDCRYDEEISFPLTVYTGFTAIVNKQLSSKYEKLVSGAPELIKVLPWGKDFEVDIFRKPDFTALEIVSFATGGTFYYSILLIDCLQFAQVSRQESM